MECEEWVGRRRKEGVTNWRRTSRKSGQKYGEEGVATILSGGKEKWREMKNLSMTLLYPPFFVFSLGTIVNCISSALEDHGLLFISTLAVRSPLYFLLSYFPLLSLSFLPVYRKFEELLFSSFPFTISFNLHLSFHLISFLSFRMFTAFHSSDYCWF